MNLDGIGTNRFIIYTYMHAHKQIMRTQIFIYTYILNVDALENDSISFVLEFN